MRPPCTGIPFQCMFAPREVSSHCKLALETKKFASRQWTRRRKRKKGDTTGGRSVVFLKVYPCQLHPFGAPPPPQTAPSYKAPAVILRRSEFGFKAVGGRRRTWRRRLFRRRRKRAAAEPVASCGRSTSWPTQPLCRRAPCRRQTRTGKGCAGGRARSLQRRRAFCGWP